MDVELLPSVLPMFLAAGWRRGREIVSDIPASHPAHLVLRSFSGLRVGVSGRGETCGSSDIDFFLLDPAQGDDETRDWERLLAVTLIGVGETSNGHGELWIANDGRCFGRSLIHRAFSFEGENFTTASERLLLGRKARPLIHPSQDEVMFYGDMYSRNHPDVYRYA